MGISREEIFQKLESWKTEQGIKDSQDVLVKIDADKETCGKLASFADDLPNLLRVSWVELHEADSSDFRFEQSPYLRCERSRLRRPDVEEVNGVPLTKRDQRVLGW